MSDKNLATPIDALATVADTSTTAVATPSTQHLGASSHSTQRNSNEHNQNTTDFSAHDNGRAGITSNDQQYRVTVEDYVLWGVIAAVLGYFAWYLHSTTTSLRETENLDRLAAYGLNVRANLVLLIGAALALLGCMIVLRRVRTVFSADAGLERGRARVVADSAGIVIVILAVLLLSIVVTHPPIFEHGKINPAEIRRTDEQTSTLLNERLKELERQQSNDHEGAGSGENK